MPRIARMVVNGEPAVYHVVSRTALKGFVLGNAEKEYLVNLIKRLSLVYFTEVLGFCVMGSHPPFGQRYRRKRGHSELDPADRWKNGARIQSEEE